ncbi:unnamed protein product, partial [Prorocentrum cordatum]
MRPSRSSVIDKAAQRRAWQRWPGVIELEDIAKLSSKKTGPSFAIATAGSPGPDLSGLDANGRGLAGNKSSLFFRAPRATKAVAQAFGARRTRWLVENVAGMNAEDSLLISQQLGIKPCRTDAMDVGLVRRLRLHWLSRALRPRAGVIDVTEEARHRKATLHDGWSILVPSHALRTFAKLHKRVSPSAPVAGIKSTSETAIARWTEARYVSQVYNFEDEMLLWNTSRTARLIPSANERETLMGFDRGYIRAAAKESAPSRETKVIRSSPISNPFSVQVASHVLAQLLDQETKQGAPPILPFLITSTAPEPSGRAPDFESTGAQDTDLAQQLVLEYLRVASRGGAGVRLDLQGPFRDAHLNELEVGAAVNAIKWRSRTAVRFQSRYLHPLDSQVAAS